MQSLLLRPGHPLAPEDLEDESKARAQNSEVQTGAERAGLPAAHLGRRHSVPWIAEDPWLGRSCRDPKVALWNGWREIGLRVNSAGVRCGPVWRAWMRGAIWSSVRTCRARWSLEVPRSINRWLDLGIAEWIDVGAGWTGVDTGVYR